MRQFAEADQLGLMAVTFIGAARSGGARRCITTLPLAFVAAGRPKNPSWSAIMPSAYCRGEWSDQRIKGERFSGRLSFAFGVASKVQRIHQE